MTLIFELLTLNFYCTSDVISLNYVQNLSEIEQSAAELWIILQIFEHVISRCDLDL